MACLAILNTISMSISEQQNELSLLRAVGMSSGQTRKMMLCQALFIATIGVCLGMISGITAAYIVNAAAEPLVGYSIPFTLHGRALAICSGGAFGLIFIAAWMPTERALRSEVVDRPFSE